MIYLILLLFCAYLLGSVNFAILLCSISGYPDPRTHGSLNPGATNVLRVANKPLALLVLICDSFKGFLPVLVANFVLESDFYIALVGLAAFLGHLYPVFFGFKGGKGVATYLGVLAALYYPVLILFVCVWLLVVFTTKYSSLGAITAVSVSPVYLLLVGEYGILLPLLIMVILLLIKHKDNIKRLKTGTESKIKF
jgi:glycerol-3-phosphate acyltransferase PlsY